LNQDCTWSLIDWPFDECSTAAAGLKAPASIVGTARSRGAMATPATRDMEIEILAGLQEMLAQQAIALRMLRRLHNTVDQWIQRRVQETEGERGGGRASRSRSPLRPTPAEVDRLRYQRGRHAMSETVAWEEARQEDPDDPIEDPTGPTHPPVEEMPTIPGITMASEVLPAGQQSAADTVDPTLIRH